MRVADFLRSTAERLLVDPAIGGPQRTCCFVMAHRFPRGPPGQPGYWQVQGRIGDGDRLALVGTNIARSKAYFGQTISVRFDGRFGTAGYERSGAFGRRGCTLKMTRAGS